MIHGSAAPHPQPFEESIDLSGPGAYADAFPVSCSAAVEKTGELRIGEAGNDLFVRVRCAGWMIEISSGLLRGGVRCEAWHGVASGRSVKGQLRLHCDLRCDGTACKLDVRLVGDGSDTLIYGSSRVQGAAFGSKANVRWKEVDGDDEWAAPPARPGSNGARKTADAVSAISGNGNGGDDVNGGAARLAARGGSSVRFCEADEWYEYEVPRVHCGARRG